VDRTALTAEFVARLLADQFPQWSDLPIRPVELNGWDNITFRLGEELSVRLPSHDVYVAGIDKEHRWLPVLAPQLPLPIPEPVAKGRPSPGSPGPKRPGGSDLSTRSSAAASRPPARRSEGSMSDPERVGRFLAGASVDRSVFELRPDYRALLLAVDGLVSGPSDATSDALLLRAEDAAREALIEPPERLARVATWRDAYRSFGAKPQRTRNSLEALLRRASAGMPRVNRLTDIYNAVSVIHQIPLGGEDLARYDGPPRCVRASGEEPFDTVANGVEVVEHPEPGEVVWRDETGVTCRCWNWRQARRTQLREDTSAALFILDGLEPVDDAELHAAAEDLLNHLVSCSPELRVARLQIGAATAL
jgi:DNA/RNA-binding domain of Phe-tRNA-synthetase-like protein